MSAMRLQRFLSAAGVASRRASEDLIREGRVRVNGRPVEELGTKVDPERDRVEVDGEEIRPAAPEWIALHKPRGYVVSRSDPRGRRTVYDLLPPDLQGLFHVGRLDFDSEGLLLFTNEGGLAHRLLHPSYGAQRVYVVQTNEALDDEDIDALQRGVRLEDGVAKAYRVTRLPPTRAGAERVELTLREGRNREVRRMFEALDKSVRRLTRVRYGPVKLEALPRGKWRRLSRAERARLGGRGRGRTHPRTRRGGPA